MIVALTSSTDGIKLHDLIDDSFVGKSSLLRSLNLIGVTTCI